ncbi:unnamed protein product [Meloidogyne enterolobii]|uniref:Uncharacterized protein n=4 Tax=Meloidogyne enterolobii TaxID=390850 RepID=A0A6V7X0R6_MELEN|nr:unnamed protein product [Meloidogyne enterolobii]
MSFVPGLNISDSKKVPDPGTIVDTVAEIAEEAEKSSISSRFGFQFDDDPETFIEVVLRFLWSLVIDYGFYVVCGLSLYSLIVMLIKKRYMAGIVNRWKLYLNYRGTLKRMSFLLERNYKIELWSDQEFCKSYLQLYESFRFFRSMANRDHKGDSIIDDIKQQAEAYPLYPFFNVDYNLRDRLLYALEGVDWVGKDEDEEELTAKSLSELTAKSTGADRETSSEEFVDGLKKRQRSNAETVTARDTKSDRSVESNFEKGSKFD